MKLEINHGRNRVMIMKIVIFVWMLIRINQQFNISNIKLIVLHSEYFLKSLILFLFFFLLYQNIIFHELCRLLLIYNHMRKNTPISLQFMTFSTREKKSNLSLDREYAIKHFGQIFLVTINSIKSSDSHHIFTTYVKINECIIVKFTNLYLYITKFKLMQNFILRFNAFIPKIFTSDF